MALMLAMVPVVCLLLCVVAWFSALRPWPMPLTGLVDVIIIMCSARVIWRTFVFSTVSVIALLQSFYA